MKKIILSCLVILLTSSISAQTLEKMLWFNEPEQWQINGKTLSINTPGSTDYWRIAHYGFTVDDAPFYYTNVGGEFEMKVKISGEYKARFDQAGLMIRLDHEHWIKAGIEYVDGKYNLSTVVTHTTSDWSVIQLEKPVPYIWIKAIRRLDAIHIQYSFDDITYVEMRQAWFPDNCPVMVGMVSASPDGEGFTAKFDNFQVKHLADTRRLEWLKNNKE